MKGRSIIEDLRQKMLHKHKEDPFWSVFGLIESPFQVADNIDAKYFYESSNHRELIDKLHSYIIHEAAYIYAVTGLAGVGKTFTYNVFANRFILQQEQFRQLMRQDGYSDEQIAQVPVYQTMRFQNTTYGQAGEQVNVPMIKKFMLKQLNPSLKSLIDDLDVYHNPHHKEKVHTLWMDAMVHLAKKNRVLILFIDEAQGLDLDMIRSIRLMTGVNETMLKHVLTVVFIGTTDLMDKMNQDDAVKSRLNEHFLLEPLNREETGEMIRFRLSVASKNEKMTQLIPEDVIDLLFEMTGGIPRSIFQKLSTAFRALREKHSNGDSDVMYFEREEAKYPMLGASLFRELFPEAEASRAEVLKEGEPCNPVLKMTDSELMENICKSVEDRIGRFNMKVSKNAWAELLGHIRSQVLTLDDVVNDFVEEVQSMAVRYTIHKVNRLYKTKAGELNEC